MNTRKPLSCISTKRLARKRLAIALSLVFSGLGTLSLSQTAAAADDYFTAFITSSTSPVIFALLFMGVTAFIVYNGSSGAED